MFSASLTHYKSTIYLLGKIRKLRKMEIKKFANNPTNLSASTFNMLLYFLLIFLEYMCFDHFYHHNIF